MKYLLDTNILSELVRPRPDASVAAKVRACERDCVTASIVYLELWAGVEKLGDTARGKYLRGGYRNLFAPGGLEVLPFDREAARWLAHELARLLAQGRPPPTLDSQIAATAATRDLTLVTGNTRDFECFQGLRLENWFAPDKD
ncbi:type II toxin-antitoxin system VapC family toxin [Pseudothauera nasutitermitis]|uniref:Ribonuclease VapC n=1 Tax=Pseudothauera nasutitermitis TaxID=2565930 RepID=A0A4S4AVH5_9RHOO|nr:type II toxin-antitoxin system VapC family toxin [Pseudothauera nasutitermitis]THF64027.1 type II toxin-antitoxin system VapC family toxin [Pseudothauera nasutitermitis]